MPLPSRLLVLLYIETDWLICLQDIVSTNVCNGRYE